MAMLCRQEGVGRGLYHKEALGPSHQTPTGPWRAHVELDPENVVLKLTGYDDG